MDGCPLCGEQVMPDWRGGWEVRCPACDWFAPCETHAEAEQKADVINEGSEPIVWKQLDNKS